ncbi:hypothetical protein EXU85_20515 [Spirosoma sp. KCTC 42546]|uniref:hypothetical protein n=1 Tax=Spirosoma sp. KCTC 42546 TaxID=2520506 RepID=UPI0011593E64|nr:hypothetical protein [Spirosoma sp. KCTC 42546]QDK80864.1 hypothetical protein EXU85_20515 [Spirosoma sp. KCTC 42546]
MRKRTNLMISESSPSHLLKEYIQFLSYNRAIFPGIKPRPWGQDFSRSELDLIQLELSRLVDRANDKTDQLLIRTFNRLGQPGFHLHWFVIQFQADIVRLLTPSIDLSTLYDPVLAAVSLTIEQVEYL